MHHEFARRVSAHGLLLVGFIAYAFLGREEKQRPASALTAIANAAQQSDIAGSGAVRPLPDDWFVYEKRFDGSAVRGLFDVSPRKNDWTIDDMERWNRENPEQAKAYQDRLWRAEFATLVLFEQNCAPRKFDSVRREMFTKWNALPEAERTEALNHEIGQIKRRKDYVWPQTGEVFPGGLKWFCSVMDDRLKHGSYNDMIYPSDAKRN